MSQKGEKRRIMQLEEKEWKSEGSWSKKEGKEETEKIERGINKKQNGEDNQSENEPSMNRREGESCRTKYGHLLPRYLSSKLTKNHIDLLNFSDKIDSYLLVSQSKSNSKFVLLSQIVKYFKKQYSSDQIIKSFRQILYLDNTFYSYELYYIGNNFDIRIDIDFEKSCKISRRIQLRKLIFDFSIKNNGNKIVLLNSIDDYDEINQSFQKQEDTIPMITLETNSASLIESTKQFQNHFDPLSLTSHSILRPVNIKLLSFRSHLYSSLSSKQLVIPHNSTLSFSTLPPQKSYLRIVDQIHSIYYTRKVRSIFLVILIQSLFKRTSYSQSLLSQTINHIINSSQYLTSIHSQGGVIISINMKIYKQFRQSILL